LLWLRSGSTASSATDSRSRQTFEIDLQATDTLIKLLFGSEKERPFVTKAKDRGAQVGQLAQVPGYKGSDLSTYLIPGLIRWLRERSS
jgi:hypothetical protein